MSRLNLWMSLIVMSLIVMALSLTGCAPIE